MCRFTPQAPDLGDHVESHVGDALGVVSVRGIGRQPPTALTNFGFIANAVLATDEVVAALHEGAALAVS